jgi:hypothetical protein
LKECGDTLETEMAGQEREGFDDKLKRPSERHLASSTTHFISSNDIQKLKTRCLFVGKEGVWHHIRQEISSGGIGPKRR